MLHLKWHNYQYFPYERTMALRELEAVLGIEPSVVDERGVFVDSVTSAKQAAMLTYFASVESSERVFRTVQAHLESEQSVGKSRQSTRYSVHGLHEYKGKFNPQVARAILNVFGAKPGVRVLDPFCGSGTTLVECAHLGAAGFGYDVNPMAVFVANTKLAALGREAAAMRTVLASIVGYYAQQAFVEHEDDARAEYLLSWFGPEAFVDIERLRTAIEMVAGEDAPFFLVIASNLLREYSQQEPGDLRIRRRKSPMPEKRLLSAFEEASDRAIAKLEQAQQVVGLVKSGGFARLLDSRKGLDAVEPFDFALTSPPYAMALPYIDTQRLSLVWLGMCSPKEINSLDAALVGSREIRTAESNALRLELQDNKRGLPAQEVELCQELQNGLGVGDGFRRQAVPTLLYRYFDAMRENFRSVYASVKPQGRYALIIGHNRTTIGGKQYDIDTPHHLGSLASQVGWSVEEKVELQTYHRFGIHASNAITSETLLVLRK